jgi:hypothetical protein
MWLCHGAALFRQAPTVNKIWALQPLVRLDHEQEVNMEIQRLMSTPKVRETSTGRAMRQNMIMIQTIRTIIMLLMLPTAIHILVITRLHCKGSTLKPLI